MKDSFFFYDLETSGVNPREARIVQFAGQRVDLDLKPTGKPFNYLIALSEDVLPDPRAVLVTGITPQQTRAEGITEAEFLRIFHAEIVTPNTTFVGFNSLRFDDEFMRYLHYRNFYDPYEWQWKDGRSRWDLLDLARMTRALRPEGIEWPFDSSGEPSNRLELLTAVNKLEHHNAHDAMGDVNATIALAQFLKQKQPKLFGFLLGLRDKRKVAELVKAEKPFLYTSGRYPGEFEKTTAVATLTDHPKRQGVLVYDLRHDPQQFAKLSVQELAEMWQKSYKEEGPHLPIKTLAFNRCPAVAPLAVLDKDSQERLQLQPAKIKKHWEFLRKSDLAAKASEASEIIEEKRQTQFLESENDVDARLYEGFFDGADKTKMSVVRAADKDELADLSVSFKDQRLQALLPLYKARNFPEALSEEELVTWNRHKEQKLLSGEENSRLAQYLKEVEELSNRPGLTANDKYLLEELALYGQSLMPASL